MLLGDEKDGSPSKLNNVKKGKSMVVKTLRSSKYNPATQKQSMEQKLSSIKNKSNGLENIGESEEFDSMFDDNEEYKKNASGISKHR